MRRALVYFTSFNSTPGGSEYLPLLLVAELQKSFEVTLALNWKSDVASAAHMLGIPVVADRLSVVVVKPKLRFLGKIDSFIPVFSTWRLKALAKNADICFSAANMADFGKPAHHFVYLLRTFGDNAFMDYVRHLPPKVGFARFKRTARTFLAEAILRPLLGVRSTRKIISDPREHIYPNSLYVESIMREFYGEFNSSVFYPPTLFSSESSTAVARNPLRVVCVGQIFPEKRVTEIIAIVERAREISMRDLTLTIAGNLGNTAYVESVKTLADHRKWVTLAGGVYGDAKSRLLLSATYAIHAERDETFGISVTEYLKAGLIPIVPDEGGTPEVVDSPALTYRTNEDAAQILARLLSDADFRTHELAHCLDRARFFSRESYIDRQHRLIEEVTRP